MTLVELVLAVAILASVSVGATLILAPVARQSRIQREMESADIVGHRLLERLRTLRPEEILESYPPGAENRFEDLPDGVAALTYVDAEADPLEIRVHLTWTSAELGPMEITLLTARTDGAR